MTISQKLFLVATLGLNCTPFVSAYDVVGLKDEVQLITQFAEISCLPVFNKRNRLKNWLNNTINSTWMTSNHKIITIANIIKQNDVYKSCQELFEMREAEINKQRDLDCFIFGSVVTMYAGVIIYAITQKPEYFTNAFKWQTSQISNSSIETLVALDKMQRQINELTKQINKTWFQKLFAKQ